MVRNVSTRKRVMTTKVAMVNANPETVVLLLARKKKAQMMMKVLSW